MCAIGSEIRTVLIGRRDPPVYGWRVWRVRRGQLMPLRSGMHGAPRLAPWRPGAEKRSHRVPMGGDDRRAGLWCYRHEAQAWGVNFSECRFRTSVIGRVRLFGAIVEHEHGFRSHRARIVKSSLRRMTQKLRERRLKELAP